MTAFRRVIFRWFRPSSSFSLEDTLLYNTSYSFGALFYKDYSQKKPLGKLIHSIKYNAFIVFQNVVIADSSDELMWFRHRVNDMFQVVRILHREHGDVIAISCIQSFLDRQRKSTVARISHLLNQGLVSINSYLMK